MSAHVPEDLLVAFVEGELDESLGIHIAEHLDGCPACATQVAALEPLAVAFASVDDPVLPIDLVDQVLAAASEQPAQAPVTEVTLGLGLLAAAAATFALFGDPVGSMIHLSMVLEAVAKMGTVANGTVATSVAATATAGATALACSWAAARATVPGWKHA
ncbi:MAG: hypothetical protein EP330_17400 [Deltaproteobacteria bacterium]|nr:MAG: hypothetical protein EP330_17400 [Deltaproteobacteria bacterium]